MPLRGMPRLKIPVLSDKTIDIAIFLLRMYGSSDFLSHLIAFLTENAPKNLTKDEIKKYVDDRVADLLNNFNWVLELLDHGDIYSYLPDWLKSHYLIWPKALRACIGNLEYLPHEKWDDGDFIHQILNINGSALQFVPKRLLDQLTDKDYLDAVSSDGMSFRYVPCRMRSPNTVIAALCQNINAYCLLSLEDWTIDAATYVVSIDGSLLEYVPKVYQDDDVTVFAAINSKPQAIRFASKRLIRKLGYIASAEDKSEDKSVEKWLQAHVDRSEE